MLIYRIVEHGIVPNGQDVRAYLKTTDILIALVIGRHFACLLKTPSSGTATKANKLSLLYDMTNLSSKVSLLKEAPGYLYLAHSVEAYLTHLTVVSCVIDYGAIQVIITHHINRSLDYIEDWLEEHYFDMGDDDCTVDNKVATAVRIVPQIVAEFETLVNKIFTQQN